MAKRFRIFFVWPLDLWTFDWNVLKFDGNRYYRIGPLRIVKLRQW